MVEKAHFGSYWSPLTSPGVSDSVSLGTSLGVWDTCDGPVSSSHQRRGWYWVNVDRESTSRTLIEGAITHF